MTIEPHAAGEPVRLRKVSVRYPGASTSSPNEATVSVRPGEVVLLTGPSGCGKSTLSLTVNGLIPRSLPARVSGELTVHGRAVRDQEITELSRQVGMVFQDVDAQIVMETVFDEVAFGLENLCLSVPEILTRAERALRTVRLWDRRDSDPMRLSGGQRQRLAIACALAMGAEILVLDEPTANLDAAGAEDVYRAIAEAASDGKRAVLLVEHNIDAALSVIDRIVVLDAAGRTALDGPPSELIGENAGALGELGVQLPSATRIALALESHGIRLGRLPVLPEELAGLVRRHRQEIQRRASEVRAAPRSPSPTEASQGVLPEDAEPVVEFRGATVSYDRRAVLRNVDLAIPRGAFVGIVGVNGSGKSTLLRAVAGLVPVTRGGIHVHGRPAARRTIRTGDVGFVFQNPEHQFVTRSVRDELAQSLAGHRLSDREREERIHDMLVRVDLSDAAEDDPFLLSGGQKRRLSVATALIGGARLLLLDEPTFGQDQAHADELMAMLAALNAEGVTIVMATHDLNLLLDHAGHVLVVHDGSVRGPFPTRSAMDDRSLLDRAGLRPPMISETLRRTSMPDALSDLLRTADTRTTRRRRR